MSNYGQATPTQPVAKTAGIARLQDELNEVVQRITSASVAVLGIGDALYGPRPSDAEANPPSANTVDSRLGDIRRALSYLESNISRLTQA